MPGYLFHATGFQPRPGMRQIELGDSAESLGGLVPSFLAHRMRVNAFLDLPEGLLGQSPGRLGVHLVGSAKLDAHRLAVEPTLGDPCSGTAAKAQPETGKLFIPFDVVGFVGRKLDGPDAGICQPHNAQSGKRRGSNTMSPHVPLCAELTEGSTQHVENCKGFQRFPASLCAAMFHASA